MNQEKITVLLPCYNEEGNIVHLLNRFGKISEFSFNIIIIDDGSRINLKDVVSVYDYRNCSVKSIEIIQHEENYGLERAIQTGLKFVKDDWILVLDSDGQDPPELLKEQKFLNSYRSMDVCRFIRSSRPFDTFFKRFTASMYYRIMHLISFGKFREQSANFVLFKRELLPSIFINLVEGMAFRNSIVHAKKKSMIYHYVRLERNAGVTNYNLTRLFSEATRNISQLFLNSNLVLIIFILFISEYLTIIYLVLRLIFKFLRIKHFNTTLFQKWII